MKTLALLVPLAASATLACMHGGAPSRDAAPATASAPASPTAQPARQAGMCPLDVPGAQVSAADIPGGETLTFTTTSGEVLALRERVRAMVEMHNEHHAGGAAAGAMHHGHGGMAGGRPGMHGSGDAGGMMMPPPSRAVAENVDGGARVVVTPIDPADLPKLQSAVRAHAQHMKQHGCGMMGAGPAHR